MIIVRVVGVGDVHVTADKWHNDGDGDLDCYQADKVVATFPRGRWTYVHQETAVTKKPASPLSPPHGILDC